MTPADRTISRPVWLVADDYGLSPSVSEGIRSLIAARRISGTGCMTLFPEWPAEAKRLNACANVGSAAIGLHLTLTDFPPLTGISALAPLGWLPPLKTTIAQSWLQRDLEPLIHAELDAQLDAFVSAFGRMPHYIDGHQHVHFLAPVRSWLAARFTLFFGAGPVPWLRGAPSIALVDGLVLKAKVSAIAMLGTGFDRTMRSLGYPVHGPLAGFYDWSLADGFLPMLSEMKPRFPRGAIVMCHPGRLDEMLVSRDRLVESRKAELDVLAGPPIVEILDRGNLAPMRSDSNPAMPGARHPNSL